MDATKLSLAVASLTSGIVLMLSLFGVIPDDKVDDLGIALNQITGAVSGILMLLFPSVMSIKKTPND